MYFPKMQVRAINHRKKNFKNHHNFANFTSWVISILSGLARTKDMKDGRLIITSFSCLQS